MKKLVSLLICLCLVFTSSVCIAEKNNKSSDGNVLIKNISIPSKIKMDSKTYTIEPKIKPDNATNKKLEYSSSDLSVAKVDSNGHITAVSSGSCVITVASTDGSKKTAKIKVTVPLFLNYEKEYTMFSKDGLDISIDCFAPVGAKFNCKNSNTRVCNVDKITYSNNQKALIIHIAPRETGKAELTITEDTTKKKIKFKVSVTSAVGYNKLSYKDVSRNVNAFIGTRYVITGRMSRKFEIDDSGSCLYLIYTSPKGWWYENRVEAVAYEGVTEIPVKILEDDIVTVYGVLLSDDSFLQNVLTGTKSDSLVMIAERIVVN